MLRTEDRDERPFVARESGCLVDQIRRHRSAADGEHFQEPPRSTRRASCRRCCSMSASVALRLPRLHALRRNAPAAPAGTDCHQPRATARAARPRLTVRSAGISDAITSRVSSSVIGSSGRAVRDGDPAPSQQRLQKRLGRDFFRAQAGHHQERWRVGRPQQVLEQEHAVRVRPVQVVDVAARAAGASPFGSAARATPRMPAALRRAAPGSPVSPRAARATASTCSITGKAATGRRPPTARASPPASDGSARRYVTQAVDDPVERLVRNRLVLVAAAAKHHRIVAVRQLVEELLDQRGLADAGGTVNADSRRTALSDRGERCGQNRQLPRAADKAWLQPCAARCRRVSGGRAPRSTSLSSASRPDRRRSGSRHSNPMQISLRSSGTCGSIDAGGGGSL